MARTLAYYKNSFPTWMCKCIYMCMCVYKGFITGARGLRWRGLCSQWTHSGYTITDSIVNNGEGNGTPLQYSCLENPMDGGALYAAVHGVAKSQTRLSDFPFTFHFHALEKEMATHASVLAWRIPGTGSLVGCRLWGCTELDTTEAT